MPKLSLSISNKWSKEARVGAKLERIASRRLGGSPTDWKPRGPNTLQVESQDPSIQRRRSSISLQSTHSAMKALAENFGKGIGDLGDGKMNSLRSDYKTMIKLLDNLDYPGWKRFASHLKEGEVMTRLTETTDPVYPEDVQSLSHALIFRFVMAGFLKFHKLDKPVNADEEQFVLTHIQFLATKHPASLLGATILTEHASDLKTLEEHIENEWKQTELPEVLHESLATVQKYTQRFGGIPASIQKHARYLLDRIIRTDSDDGIMDMSLFIGLLPWMYFQLDPKVNEGQWIRHSLRVDKQYWRLVNELFEEPVARFKVVQNLGIYYKEDPESNTVLHLMIYLWGMKRFGVSPNDLPPADVGKSEVYNCSEELIKAFTPGFWQSQTYYVCTQGETIVWALSHLPRNNENARLICLIIKNLGSWKQVTQDRTLHLGMIRTLYLALKSCGVKDFLDQSEPKDVIDLGWHLGGLFTRRPSHATLIKIQVVEPEEAKDGAVAKSSSGGDQVPETEIVSILTGGDDLSLDTLSTEVETDADSWMLKIKFSTAILKMVLSESDENSATKLFQALSAVCVRAEPNGPDDATELLHFLIKHLKRSETREDVLKEADHPATEVPDAAIEEESQT